MMSVHWGGPEVSVDGETHAIDPTPSHFRVMPAQFLSVASEMNKRPILCNDSLSTKRD
jgi:hypothetical protein